MRGDTSPGPGSDRRKSAGVASRGPLLGFVAVAVLLVGAAVLVTVSDLGEDGPALDEPAAADGRSRRSRPGAEERGPADDDPGGPGGSDGPGGRDVAGEPAAARAPVGGVAAGDIPGVPGAPVADPTAAPVVPATAATPSSSDPDDDRPADAGAAPRTRPATGPGAATARAAGTAGPAGAKPGRLSIRVLAAEDDSPLRGASVVVTDTAGAQFRATTDAAGRASIEGLGGASAVLEARAPGRVRRREPAPSSGRSGGSITLRLEEGFLLAGTITSTSGGVPGATVRVFDLDAWNRAIPYDGEPDAIDAVTTDAWGRYELDALPLNRACVAVVSASGHADSWSGIDPVPGPDCAVLRDLALRPGARVSGTVTVSGADGKQLPAAGAIVWVEDERLLPPRAEHLPDFPERDLDDLRFLEHLARAWSDRSERPWMARTDAAGAFSVEVPAEVARVRAMAFRTGSGRSFATDEAIPGRNCGALVLRGRVTAEFHVTASTGRPAEGIRVTSYLPWESWIAASRGAGRYGSVTCDVGPVLIHISGGADAPGAYAGRFHDADHLVWMTRTREGRTVRGLVTDESGRGVGGARVTAGPVSTETGMDGRFELQGVRERERAIDVSADGYSPERETLPEDTGLKVKVRLLRTCDFRTELVLPRGDPPPKWFRVWCGPVAAGEGRTLPAAAWNGGILRIPDLGADERLVIVVLPGYSIVCIRPEFGAGKVVTGGSVDLRRRERRLARVTDEGDVPVPGARVTIRASPDDPWSRAIPEASFVADPGGRVTIEDWGSAELPPTNWTAIVSADGFQATPSTYHRAESEPVFVVGRGRTIHVRVSSGSGGSEPWVCRATGPDGLEYATVGSGHANQVTLRVPLLPRLIEIHDPGGLRLWSGVPAATDARVVDIDVALPD